MTAAAKTGQDASPPHIDIDVSQESPLWDRAGFDVRALSDTVLKQALSFPDVAALLPAGLPLEVSVALVGDAEIRVLNAEYRQKDKPTNVLSFPYVDLNEDIRSLPPEMAVALGDIVLSFETIETEAREQQKPLKDHFTHLLVHGLLHLLGHDHMADDEAETMESAEIRILAGFGIENPYI